MQGPGTTHNRALTPLPYPMHVLRPKRRTHQGSDENRRPPGDEQGFFHWEYSQPYVTSPERSQGSNFPAITVFPTSYLLLGSPLTWSRRVWEAFCCSTKRVSPFCLLAPSVVFVWVESLYLQPVRTKSHKLLHHHGVTLIVIFLPRV